MNLRELAASTNGGPEPYDIERGKASGRRLLEQCKLTPEKVREVWDRTGEQVRKIRDHHLFLRTPSDDQFFYAGEAHLGSYGSTRTSSGDWGLAGAP